MCTANIGIGQKMDPPIKAGLKWLLRIIDVLRQSSNLEQRVKDDVEQMRKIEKEKADQKRKQVQAIREAR